MFYWLNIVQILLIVVLLYSFYVGFIKNTTSEKLVRGLFGLAILWGISFIMLWMHLDLIGGFFRWIALFISISLIVVFQPELRKVLVLMGNIHGWKNILRAFKKGNIIQQENRQEIEEILMAINYMSMQHTGALIAFVKDTENIDIERKGIKLDAIITKELLLTIFFNKTPLHDGAVLINEGKIIYAGAILPLSQNKLNWKYGTRHRAAIGMSETTGSTVLVVSEETGDISLVEKGIIKKYEDIKKLKSKLEKVI